MRLMPSASRVDGRSIAHHGDVSMFSFHATKLYHSIEGGMLVFADPELKRTFDDLKNFGFRGETEVVAVGTNAKMNELQALMGELVLERIDEIIAAEPRSTTPTSTGCATSPACGFPHSRRRRPPQLRLFPHRHRSSSLGATRDDLYARLREHNVFARRYFYPLLCDWPVTETCRCPIR
jgi:dTDP-4-amino-4,6-dideoxygalactose transaminase